MDISIGRQVHPTSTEVDREIKNWKRDSEATIRDATASAIASWWHSPAPRDLPFLLLGQGSPVDRDDLIIACEREMRDGNAAIPELEALADWATRQS